MVDPVVELEAGVAAQVLDRALQLRASPSARSASGQLRVDDDDEPVVVGDRGPGPRRRLDLDLVGGQGDATRATLPSGEDLERCPRAAAMTAGIAAPSFLPIFGSSGLIRRSTSSDSSPIRMTSLTLTSSAKTSRSASRSGWATPGSAIQSRASGWRVFRPACERSVRASSTAAHDRHRVLEARIAEGAEPARRPARQVHAVGARTPLGPPGSGGSPRSGTGAAAPSPAPARRASHAASRTPRRGRRRRPSARSASGSGAGTTSRGRR